MSCVTPLERTPEARAWFLWTLPHVPCPFAGSALSPLAVINHGCEDDSMLSPPGESLSLEAVLGTPTHPPSPPCFSSSIFFFKIVLVIPGSFFFFLNLIILEDLVGISLHLQMNQSWGRMGVSDCASYHVFIASTSLATPALPYTQDPHACQLHFSDSLPVDPARGHLSEAPAWGCEERRHGVFILWRPLWVLQSTDPGFCSLQHLPEHHAHQAAIFFLLISAASEFPKCSF